jgi:glycosyltransferase 2 family protein
MRFMMLFSNVRWPKFLAPLLKFTVSVAILTALFLFIDREQFFKIFSQYNPWALLGLIAILSSQLFFLSWRWQILINHSQWRLSFFDSFSMTSISTAMGNLFLTSLGGTASRMAMAYQKKIPLTDSFVFSMLDRICSFAAILILFYVSLFWLLPKHVVEQNLIFVLYLIPILIGLICFYYRPISCFLLRFSILKRFRPLYVSIRRSHLLSYRTILMLCAISLLPQIILYGVIFILFQMAQSNLSLSDYIAITPFIMLISSIPISVGGWGLREASFVFGFGLVGVAHAESFAVSVTAGFINILASVLCAVLMVLRNQFFSKS